MAAGLNTSRNIQVPLVLRDRLSTMFSAIGTCIECEFVGSDKPAEAWANATNCLLDEPGRGLSEGVCGGAVTLPTCLEGTLT